MTAKTKSLARLIEIKIGGLPTRVSLMTQKSVDLIVKLINLSKSDKEQKKFPYSIEMKKRVLKFKKINCE